MHVESERVLSQRLGIRRGFEDDGDDAGEPFGLGDCAILERVFLPADFKAVVRRANYRSDVDSGGTRADFGEGISFARIFVQGLRAAISDEIVSMQPVC